MTRRNLLALAGLAPLLRAGDAPVHAVLEAVARSESIDPTLRQVCDELGARPAGTPAMRRAVDWALAEFRDIGVDEAHAEEFTIPMLWQEGDTRVEVLEPVAFQVQAAATAWSPPTRRKGIEAEVIDGGSRAGDIERLGAAVRDKIVLMRLDEVRTFYDLGIEQRDAIVALREAAAAGAAALLLVSTRGDRLLYRHIHSVNGEIDPLPSALVTREDGLRIARLLDADKTVRVRLRLPNHIEHDAPDSNVIAEIRGREKPDEIVLLGAHFDSWDMGTGCLDNGVNVTLVIEVARAIVRAGVRARRTIRFALFSGEEAGLLGSWAYVRRHCDELDRFVAVIVHDMGLGEIEGYALNGRAELEEPLRKALEPLGRSAPQRNTTEAFFGSDHFDFLLEGVPALVAMQDTSGYVRPYHSAADTYNQVEPGQLRQRIRTAAAACFGIADLEERFGPRLDRQGVEQLLDRTQLDEQMRFLHFWDQWQSGARGRAPSGG
ncbi:MAG: M28 family peptidase [Acidobacteria bacterium]|nr:M28 family peptidase [Acidobacteriota bacterium]